MFLTALPDRIANNPGHDFWFSPVESAGPTLSGAVVTSDSAMRLSTVYKCVKVIAESGGILPRHLYEVSGEGDSERRTRVRSHPVAQLLQQPNQWQTPLAFYMMLEAHKQLRGNGYAEIQFDRREQPSALIPLHPDRCALEVAANGLPRLRVRPRPGSNEAERVLVPGEYLHVAGMSLDGYTGVSPITAQRETIGGAIAARAYGARFWANDAKPPFWIEYEGKVTDKTAFRLAWQEAYGGANRHKPAVMDNGMKLHELGITNSDSQWLESIKASDIDVCGIYRTPPHKVGILDRATWGNVEQQNIDFVTDCLLPNLVGWEQSLRRDLVVEDDLFIAIVPEQLLRGDIKTRYQAYSMGIRDGHLTRNEVRRMENRNPLDGLDEPLQPLNMASAGSADVRTADDGEEKKD